MTEITINAAKNLATPDDRPIPYLQRVREYYLALGYAKPYQFAHYTEVPFTPLTKPLSQCKLALVTTAAPFKEGAGAQGPGAAYNGAAKFFSVYEFDSESTPDLRISHIAYDRKHTHARDINSYLPLVQLRAARDSGLIGSLARSGYGLPTNRSQRTTTGIDCPELLARLQHASVDAAVLVPNCPVCHQSVSLAARHLESAGIATVIMGCAKDIVEYVGVPRLVFSDFPLGNAAGKPDDVVSQRQTLQLALDLLVSAHAARTTVQSPQRFADDCDWKLDFYNIDRLSTAERDQLKEEFERQKQMAKTS